MVQETNEYNSVTHKLIGNWGISTLKFDGSNVLKTIYEKGTANFDFTTRTAKFTLRVAEGKLTDKLLDWEKKFPDIKIDEYKIVYLANWLVSEDGKTLLLNSPEVDLVIKGSGENFEGFYAWEKTKFNVAKSMDDGSLLGSALGSLAKSATGTSDLFPDFEDSYKIYNISKDGKSVKLTNGKSAIYLIK